MIRLAMNLESSAEILGTAPETFLELVEREHIGGIIRLDDQWRVSIFTLAGLLNTSPGALLELMEDYALGEMIEEVEGDELFEGQEGWQVYQGYLTEA
jgi:hypothetical protein